MLSTAKFSPAVTPSKRKRKETMARECAVCLDEFSIWETTLIDSSHVCRGCLHELFTRAAQNEEDYPPKWGSQVLNINNYLSIIPKDLIRLYREKEREYQVPPKARIYCTAVNPNLMLDVGEAEEPCGSFVGRIAENWPEKQRAFGGCLTACASCNALYCLICGEERGFAHTCTNPGRQGSDEDGFAGLIKGKDYQICPLEACSRKIELRDGCNSMTCTCGTKFCFICGEKNVKGDHFDGTKAQGTCPRFGHPSAPNRALWMGGPDEINEDAFERMLEDLVRRHGRRRRRNGDPVAADLEDEIALRLAGRAAGRAEFRERLDAHRRRLARVQVEADEAEAALRVAEEEFARQRSIRRAGMGLPNEQLGDHRQDNQRPRIPTTTGLGQHGNHFGIGMVNPPRRPAHGFTTPPTAAPNWFDTNPPASLAERNNGPGLANIFLVTAAQNNGSVAPPTANRQETNIFAQAAANRNQNNRSNMQHAGPSEFRPPPIQSTAPYPRHIVPGEFVPPVSRTPLATRYFNPPLPTGGFGPMLPGSQPPDPHRGPNGGFRPILQDSSAPEHALPDNHGRLNGRPTPFAGLPGQNNNHSIFSGPRVFGLDGIFDQNPRSNNTQSLDGSIFGGMYPNARLRGG